MFFSIGQDKKILYIVLAFLILYMLLNASNLLSLLLILPGVIIAITFHEFAHAFVADRLGDTTPRNQGRLNLNPLSHIDPVGIALLIFVHFGWGKPVQINPRNFTRNVSMETGEMLVSIAGPLMNFILAIVFAFIFAILVLTNVIGIYGYVAQVLYGIVLINIGLGVFNLIPLPPLDGSKIFMRFMPYKVKYWLQENEQILYIIFLGLWITGIAGRIISPLIDIAANWIFNLVTNVLRIFL